MGAAESKLPTSEPEPVLNFAELNFYAILRVSHSFSDDELKQAYRARAKETHPDKDRTDGATERFKKVLEAYETLRSPATRATYNEKLRQEKTKFDSETEPQANQTTEMPGQYNRTNLSHTQAAHPSPGWFSWLFDRLGFGDPLLHYVPEIYIARNQGRGRPQGISTKDIIDYLELSFNGKKHEKGPHKCIDGHTLIRNLFECIAHDEKMWGSEDEIPHYGSSDSPWSSEIDGGPFVPCFVEDFYRYWLKFETRKTFDWINPYRTYENDRRLHRKVKIENAKIHAKYRDQYDELIRVLVVSLLHADTRCSHYLQTRFIRDGELVSMDAFCDQFTRRYGHRSLAKAQSNRAQGPSTPAGAEKPKQTKSQKKRQRRKKKKGN